MTVRSNSLSNQPDFWVTATQVGAGAPVTTGSRGIILTRTGVGTYTLDLADGGLGATTGDGEVVNYSVDAAVGVFVRFADTSAVQKTLTVTNAANAAAELTNLNLGLWRAR